METVMFEAPFTRGTLSLSIRRRISQWILKNFFARFSSFERVGEKEVTAIPGGGTP